jgi:PiT family inorganic phosphate transporter
LQPIDGFAAETGAATIIEVASKLGFPLSTTHVISSSILGVGATRGLGGVRWSIAGEMLTAWIITIPICAALAYLFYLPLGLVSR